MTTPPDSPPSTPPRLSPAMRRLTFYGGWLTIVAATLGGVASLFRRPFDWTLPARCLFLISLGVGLLAQARGRGEGA